MDIVNKVSKLVISLILTLILVSSLGLVSNSFAQSTDIPIIPITRKIMVIVFDPIVSGSQTVTQYYGYKSPTTLTNQLITELNNDSWGRVSYTIPTGDFVTINAFPEKTPSGHVMTGSEYLECRANPDSHPYCREYANYTKILDNYPTLTNDVVSKLNSGEIDELWMWGADWFGFYESRLAGPGAFDYNSPPATCPSPGCNKLIPIMGFNYGVLAGSAPISQHMGFAMHSFSHRLEFTLGKLYYNDPGHSPHPITNNMGKFMAAPSWYGTSYSNNYYGCGNTHTPHNTSLYIGLDAYNRTTYGYSICEDMYNYPNLGNPDTVKQLINCSAWGCGTPSTQAQYNYMTWWSKHIPRFSGFAPSPDNKLNNWWQYLMNPNYLISPLPQAQTKIVVNGQGSNLCILPSWQYSINWSSEFAASCTASDAWSGSKPASGYQFFTAPSYDTTLRYKLTCGNSTQKTATVSVSSNCSPP